MLEVDSLCRSYGKVKAVDNLSFKVNPGEIVGFVGSNGAGKTTTMRMIIGLLTPDSGQVRFAGREMNLAEARNFGYMPEERGLYPRMKVGAQLEYLASLHGMDPQVSGPQITQWLELMNLADRRNDELQKLSLGNQQRVQLLAALVHNPHFLVLDEPFSGLDPLAVNAMSKLVKERALEGVGVLFSSHQLDLVERLCDRVVIVSKGKLVADGTVNELRKLGKPLYLVRLVEAENIDALEFALGGLAEVVQKERKSDEYGQYLQLVLSNDDPALAQRVLATSQAVGAVQEFARVRVPLSEIYAGAVETDTESDLKSVDTSAKKSNFLAKLWGGRK